MLKLDSVCDWYIKVYTYSVVQNSKIPVKNTIYIQSCEQRSMLFCYLIIIIKKKNYILLSNSKAKNAKNEQKCSLLTIKCN